METKKKKATGLTALLLALLFALPACGNAGQAGNPSEPQSTGGTAEAGTAQGSRQLTITLDDKDVIYATLLDTPASDAFASHLPLTLHMTDYAKREKHAPLDFAIDDADLENIQYPYEIGDIIYYPPGPTFAMYYDHDGREISAGMEVIARLDEEGIAVLGSYKDAVKVTVE